MSTTSNAKKALFATVPADGHFNPLTGLAKHLQSLGWEVQWFTSDLFKDRLEKLGIRHRPYRKTKDVNGSNLHAVYPERAHIGDQIERLNFDLIHVFAERAPENYEDIREIYQDFPFDVAIMDSFLAVGPIIQEYLKVPVVTVGIVPLAESSEDLAPYGMGLEPPKNAEERALYAGMRHHANYELFAPSIKVYHDILAAYGINSTQTTMFDTIIRKAHVYLQIGSPAYEYQRSDRGSNIVFAGAMLPYQPTGTVKALPDGLLQKINAHDQVVLVTQGTVEKDAHKLIIPALEGLKDSGALVIVTTGGANTAALREQYAAANVVIEDFLPYDAIMPHVSVFVTNGGYGGVLYSIRHHLPMVAAGVHEGKSEICTRVGYFKMGIDLKTEMPTAEQVREAVQQVLANDAYRQNVTAIAADLASYKPLEVAMAAIERQLQPQAVV